jgi:hypothetical protein
MKCRCQSVDSWTGAREDTFSDFVVLDYYDGAVTAVSRCSSCGAAQLFSTIAWDPSRSLMRVYGAALISPDDFVDFNNRALIRAQRSRNAAESSTQDGFDEAVSQLLVQSGPPYAVVASRDLEREITAARELGERRLAFAEPTDVVSEANLQEWLEFLGVVS